MLIKSTTAKTERLAATCLNHSLAPLLPGSAWKSRIKKLKGCVLVS